MQNGATWCTLCKHVADCWNLVQVDAVWFNFELFGTNWNSLVEIGGFWCSLVQFGSVWCNLVQFCATCWRLVELGAVWLNLEQFGATWWRLVPTGATWWSLVRLSSVNRTAAHRFLDNFVAYCSFYVYRNRSLHGRRFPRRIWAWSSYWAYKIALKDKWVRIWSFQCDAEKSQTKEGYDRVKEHIKSVRQHFCAAVN